MPTNTENKFSQIPPYEIKDGEEYMSPAQEDHFRAILAEWKRQLMEEVDSTINHLQEEQTNYADPSDRASQEEEFSLELRTRDRERKLIRKIEEAAERIDQEDYGYCDSCGIEIGIRRLEARPTATLCIDCKTFAEIKEKQVGK
ncbi:MAG: RNA polymerase-binding protein DksA [Pontibacterium sp.]